MSRLLTVAGTSARHIRDRRGMTVVEVLISLVVLSIATVGLMQMLTASTYNTIDRQAYGAAQQILSNEVERLRIAGPWPPLAALPVTQNLNAHGRPTTGAEPTVYTLTVNRVFQCNGGTWFQDQREGAVGGCASDRATARYTVSITYPYDAATRTVTQQFTVGPGEPASEQWLPALQAPATSGGSTIPGEELIF